MYNHWFDGEHMEISGKRYALNYLVTAVSNVLGVAPILAEYEIRVAITEKGLASIVARYQHGERWNDKAWKDKK